MTCIRGFIGHHCPNCPFPRGFCNTGIKNPLIIPCQQPFHCIIGFIATINRCRNHLTIRFTFLRWCKPWRHLDRGVGAGLGQAGGVQHRARNPAHQRELAQVLQCRGGKTSMDGKGRCPGNIFVKRLRPAVKYRKDYLKACGIKPHWWLPDGSSRRVSCRDRRATGSSACLKSRVDYGV